uniref:Uncharacterized protein n=1 Tax=Glossina austeni TaxID=7395 RepID=A0A1A9VAG1_GLOAU
MDELIGRYNNKIPTLEQVEIVGDTLNHIMFIKEYIEEIEVQVCQFAKSIVVKTDLLVTEGIHQIVSEVGLLPYSNEIEAIEYGKPTIFSNGTSLLYVVLIPKSSAIIVAILVNKIIKTITRHFRSIGSASEGGRRIPDDIVKERFASSLMTSPSV